MLQGDALSVQLFIGAAALTALSVAMTQAGWTHKWFVGGMFSLAAFLTICSIGWGSIEPRIPILADGMSAVASSRVAWFLAGMVPAFVVGLRIDDALRTKRSNKATEPSNKVLYELHQLIEQLKEKILSDTNTVSHDTFHEAAAIMLRLTDLGVPTPLMSKHGDLLEYEAFNTTMFRYLSAISPFLRDHDLLTARQLAEFFLDRERGGTKNA